MGGFVFEFQRVLADEFAALVVAGGGQRLEVEAASGQRHHGQPRRIEQQHRILRHPAGRDDPADAEVGLVHADHVAVGGVVGAVAALRGQERIDAAFLAAVDDDQVDIAAAGLPDFAEGVIDLGLVQIQPGGEIPGPGGKDAGGQVLDDAAHRAAYRGCALRIDGRLAAVDDGVFEVAQQFAEAFLFLVIHFIGQTELIGRQVRAADFDGGGKDLREVAFANAMGKPRRGFVGAFEGGVAEDVDDLFVFHIFGGGARIAANHGQGAAGDGGDQHQFVRAVDLNLVADAEAAGIIHIERSAGCRIHDAIVAHGVLVGQQFVFQPLVPG